MKAKDRNPNKPFGAVWYWVVIATAGSIIAGGFATGVCILWIIAGYLVFGHWPDSPAALLAARGVFAVVFLAVASLFFWASHGARTENIAEYTAAENSEECRPTRRELFNASKRTEP